MRKSVTDKPDVNPNDYDRTTKTGIEQYNEARAQRNKDLYGEIVDCVRKPSQFAEMYLGIEMYPYNQKYVDDVGSRFIIYRAGRKVGKSTSTAVKVLHLAWFANIFMESVVDVCEVLIVAPTLAQANVMMESIKNMAHRSQMYSGFITRETQTQLSVQWLTGNGVTHIYTRAAGDTGRSLRGYIPHVIIVDECAFVKHQVLNALMPAAFGQKAKIWLTSTPFGKLGYFYEKSVNANLPNKKDRIWKEYHVSTLDNPMVKDDPILVEEIKNVTSEQYTQEVLGEFLESGDALFPIYMLQDALVERISIPHSVRYYMGVDIARIGKDETVFTLIAIDDNDSVYVIKTYSEEQSSMVDMVEKIRSWCKMYPMEAVYMDETGLGAGAVDLALQSNIPAEGVVFTVQSKEEMYTNLRLLFENKRIKMEKVDKMFYQLSYMRREYLQGRMKVVCDEGLHDDYPDSLALACMAVARGERWSVVDPIPQLLG